jgi:hypothetical protein
MNLPKDIIPEDWQVAVELPHGRIYWVQPGVVAGLPDEGVVETPQLSALVYDGYRQCVEEAGHPIAVVVLVDRLGNQTPEVRAYWQGVMTPDVMCCCALVSSSFFARAISSFLMGMRKPAVPTQMFATLDQALAWSSEQLPRAST